MNASESTSLAAPGARLASRDFKRALERVSAQLRSRIEISVEGFSVDAQARDMRRAKVLDDDGFEFFAKTYFPHYLTVPPSVLHKHLFADLPRLLTHPPAPGRKGWRKAIIAPRGAAKSTLASQIFSLWCALRGVKRFIVLAMDVWEQAALMVEAIKSEIEENPRIAYDFPEFSGAGRRWREGEIVTKNDVMILAAGARQALRGRRFGPHRPDLVILDDIENEASVENPALRKKLRHWIEKTILNLGSADGALDVVMLGTVLHHDAALAQLAKAPGWDGRHFRALVQFPDRMDLWDRWQDVFLNQGEAAAFSFYGAHRAAMDAGAVVNWPEFEPLYALMSARAMSETAFLSEKQGEPVSEDCAFRNLSFWVSKKADLVYFGAVDPSLGRHGARSDPSALLVGGYDRESGTLDVVESSIARRLPDVIVADVIALATIWKPVLWFVESVQFQEFLRTEIMKAAARRNLALSAIPVTPVADKSLRIQRLQPPIAAGLIRLHASQSVLIEQLRQWPHGAHDDGPDALEMLWSGALAHAGALAEHGIVLAGRRNHMLKGFL